MARLVSSTILHRHGSRGPGASELSPISPESPIHSQWEEQDMEVLSSAGRSQILILGAWFAKRYVQSGLLDAGNGRTHWRASKSDRALESAYDFVKGYNDIIGRQAVGPTPLSYDIDADNYFRPWKVFKKEANVIKDRINSQTWEVKASENEAFLQDIFQQVDCLPSILQKPTKTLWCTTYLHALREVETFWPNDASTRDAFCKAMPSENQGAVTSLALWVWEQRFLHSGFCGEMGGRMSVDIVESALNTDRSLNIFSGHDYTILSVLAALNLVDKFEHASGFGAYLLFEVWETTDEALVIKIIFNPDPFRGCDGQSVDMTAVNESNEVVLKELAVAEMLSVVQSLRDQISLFPPPKEAKVPKSVDCIDPDSIFSLETKEQEVDLLS